MTGRVVRPDEICCVSGCGKRGAYHMHARIWGVSDPERANGHLYLETGLVVCMAHRETPPQTAEEFFAGENQRQFIDALCTSRRIEAPNLASAQWLFPPVQPAQSEAAH